MGTHDESDIFEGALDEILAMAREGLLTVRDAQGNDLDPRELDSIPEGATIVLTPAGWAKAHPHDALN